MKKVIIILFVFFLLGNFNCSIGTDNICDILNNPRKYSGENKTVTVQGKVTNSFNLFGFKMFGLTSLEDSTCSINVVTERITPNEGEIVKVKGKVEESFSWGDKRMLIIKEE